MGNPFVHAELSVDDVAAAKKFYKTLFDWKLSDLGPDMGNYVMVDVGSKTSGGGITAKMSPSQPSGWLSYVEVASVKTTIAKAQKAGAQIVVPYQEVGGMGAFGVFIDPQGAALGVWEKAKPSPKKAAKKPAAKKKSPAKKK
ncbi:MAG: VOC family protein [Kofleriaceae bacterium]